MVAVVEARSEHPVGKAVVRAAKDFDAEPGFGVHANVDSHVVQVGTDRYMRKLGIDLTSAARCRCLYPPLLGNIQRGYLRIAVAVTYLLV